MAAMRISDAEAQVMEAVWAAGAPGLAASDLLAAVGPANGWRETTVRTLVHRLIRKGALSASRAAGGGAVYGALVSREAWVGEETRGLVDRLFGGQVAALVAHVARERKASPEDLARLRRLLADLDAEDDD